MLLLNCRCLYIFFYKPTICFIVYVAYEQKEIERKQQHIEQLQQQMEIMQLQLSNTDTDIGMIV